MANKYHVVPMSKSKDGGTLVMVHTPKKASLHYHVLIADRRQALKLARRVREHLAAGGKLNPKYWVVARRAAS